MGIVSDLFWKRRGIDKKIFYAEHNILCFITVKYFLLLSIILPIFWIIYFIIDNPLLLNKRLLFSLLVIALVDILLALLAFVFHYIIRVQKRVLARLLKLKLEDERD